jgi:hypothetical protein
VIVFEPDQDVRINEIRLMAHLEVPFSGHAWHKEMTVAVQTQISLEAREGAAGEQMNLHSSNTSA